MIILVDIDGTLANIDHRRYLVEGEKKDWDKFKSATMNDTPNEWCVTICQLIDRASAHDLVFVTGREAKYRKLTEMQIHTWLKDNVHGELNLYMRKDNDFISDVELKRTIYEVYLQDKEILFAIDDNADIVDLWRSLGITTLDCAGYRR